MLINSGVNMPSFAVVVDITDDVKEETPLILDEDFELRSSHKKPSVYYRTFLTAGSCWTHKSWRICDFGEKKKKKKKNYIYIKRHLLLNIRNRPNINKKQIDRELEVDQTH